jgi:hypothetical protein
MKLGRVAGSGWQVNSTNAPNPPNPTIFKGDGYNSTGYQYLGLYQANPQPAIYFGGCFVWDAAGV